MKEVELQMQINQLLLSSGQENSKLKSIFNLMPNEIMVIEDGQSPRIETVEEYHFSETYISQTTCLFLIFKRTKAPVCRNNYLLPFESVMNTVFPNIFLKSEIKNLPPLFSVHCFRTVYYIPATGPFPPCCCCQRFLSWSPSWRPYCPQNSGPRPPKAPASWASRTPAPRDGPGCSA